MPKRSPRVHPLPRAGARRPGFAAGVAAVERLLTITDENRDDIRQTLVALDAKDVDLAALADIIASALDAEKARQAFDTLHADARRSQRDAAGLVKTLRPRLKAAVRWYEGAGRPEFADVYRLALVDVERGPLGLAARGKRFDTPSGKAGNPTMRRRARLIAALTAIRLADPLRRVKHVTKAEATVLVDAIAFS